MAFVVSNTTAATLTLKHVERKSDGTFQYRRRIPHDLRSCYSGKMFIVRSLGRDIDALQIKSAIMTDRLEKDWIVLRDRRGQESVASLIGYDLYLNSKIFINYAPKTKSVNSTNAANYHCISPLNLTSCLNIYLELHPKGKNKKFKSDNERIFKNLIARIGDVDLQSISRSHAEDFRDFSLRSQSTATVRRNLHSLTAIVNKVRKEKQLQIINPFEGLGIIGEGDDGTKRLPFTVDELKIVSTHCRNFDDEIRHIVALQTDTGCRVAEIVGLRVEDVVLNHPIPHVRIRSWGKIRTLKTTASERDIPLIGNALWAARRAVEARETTKDSDPWLFPRYASDKEIKATHASNTLNKWIRSLSGVCDQKTTHCFRHAMRDRLRAAQVPVEIQDVIGGWGTRTIGQGYGSGYPLTVLNEHMQKIVIS